MLARNYKIDKTYVSKIQMLFMFKGFTINYVNICISRILITTYCRTVDNMC